MAHQFNFDLSDEVEDHYDDLSEQDFDQNIGDDYGYDDEFVGGSYGQEPSHLLENIEKQQTPNTSAKKQEGMLGSHNAVIGSVGVGAHTPNFQKISTSFRKSVSQNNGSLEDDKPRILLMGLRRSGKSSIQKVVFQKMSPHETLFLESTNKIVKNDISNNTFVQFQIWDFPGQIDLFGDTQNFECELIFTGCGAIVYVIDAQDNYLDSITKLAETIQQASKVNDQIAFEIFIHKMDGISDDHKIQIQQDIQQRLSDELNDSDIKVSPNVKTRFHMTSIYDHSIFEAFSKVIQKLIPQLPTLENLLDLLVTNSRLEKAFLFDVVSKIYIATDATPVDNTTYELCSDMIDVVIDISCIYGNRVNGGEGTTGAYDEETGAVIKLNNGSVLYLREVNKYLALVCLLTKDSYEKVGLINYNFDIFKQAIENVFQVRSTLQKKKRDFKKKKDLANK
ncbi:hypothetical protein FDP41_004608 [Naegleria fowleri]|nr:uncharacterized protein FDP41_004608 [Naegleria fowleri]KAF0976381.1 hypothetical protein FDP41_004608 [Naegleria fowleri]